MKCLSHLIYLAVPWVHGFNNLHIGTHSLVNALWNQSLELSNHASRAQMELLPHVAPDCEEQIAFLGPACVLDAFCMEGWHKTDTDLNG